MRKNNYKVLVSITKEEARYMLEILIDKRNECVQRGIPVDDLNEVILKLYKA